MPLISDTNQKKLEKLNINIKTKYIVNKNILERNTDNSKNDNIKDGIRCEKDYFYNNKLLYIEKNFDIRMQYSYIQSDLNTVSQPQIDYIREGLRIARGEK